MTEIPDILRKVKMLRPSGTIFPAGHFYSPYPDLKDVESRRDTIFDRSCKEVPGIDLREKDQMALVERIATRYYDEFPFHPAPADDNRFRLDNDAFSYCDAVMLYAMLRFLKPDRVIEIGSGNSSALMLDINEQFLGSDVDFTFIEPYPGLLESLMTVEDEGIVALIDKPLHAVDKEVFSSLESGDLLFVDSTHVSKAGSDVNEIFFKILPSLKSGTYIHIHDIFFPFEYPEEWIKDTRGWNEDYLVRAFLQNNPNYEILLFNHFLGIHHQPALARLMPLAAEKSGGSLWLKKVGDG